MLSWRGNTGLTRRQTNRHRLAGKREAKRKREKPKRGAEGRREISSSPRPQLRTTRVDMGVTEESPRNRSRFAGIDASEAVVLNRERERERGHGERHMYHGTEA